ncbi:MAG TPA: DUF1801 domain-containing protein [Pedobacter sp.]|nr:DUF1801 domain-containing protein [Pedobacter sp.]
MLTPLDDFYQQKAEPIRSCMLALRDYLLAWNPDLTAEWKYKLPFFYYKGKMFCYLWIHKTCKQPYIGIVRSKNIDHPDLLIEKRAKMKILLIDPNKDLPVEKIQEVLSLALANY